MTNSKERLQILFASDFAHQRVQRSSNQPGTRVVVRPILRQVSLVLEMLLFMVATGKPRNSLDVSTQLVAKS